MQLRHSVFGVAATFCAVIVAGVVVDRAAPARREIVVTVDATSSIGVSSLRLGTQFVVPGTLDVVPGTRSRLEALAPPLVRINAAAFGPRPVLPAGIVRGDWDFGSLDSIVEDARRGGGEVLLTVAYAPEWMWDCGVPAIRDPTFGEFGEYMARLVAYFDRGSFVAEDGRQIVNPAGLEHRIRYWELWNEPDQIAGCPPAGNRITPAEYVAMWNAAVPRMLAIDPTIKVIGPATAQAFTASRPDYLAALLDGATHKPDIISFHAYGGWSNSQSDRFLLDGAVGKFGLPAIAQETQAVRAIAPRTPIWITELNVNSAWDRDDPTERPWTAFGAAWGGSAFRLLALDAADAVFQYRFSHPDLRQLSLVDERTGSPLLVYWRDYYLARYFPPGSEILSSTSSHAGIEVLAARPPGSRDVHVLVVDRVPDGGSTLGGPGQAASVRVEVRGPGRGRAVMLRMVDARTPLDTGPLETPLGRGAPAIVEFLGYGAAFLAFDGKD